MVIEGGLEEEREEGGGWWEDERSSITEWSCDYGAKSKEEK